MGNASGNPEVAVKVHASVTLITEKTVETGAIPLAALLGKDAPGVEIVYDAEQGISIVYSLEDLTDDLGFSFMDRIAAVLSANVA